MAEFKFSKLNDIGVLSIGGRFTLVDKDEFQALVEDNVDLSAMDLALDARHLDYIDSSGIGDFIKLKMEANKFKRQVYVFGLKDAVEKTFRSARLESVFEVMTEDEFKSQFNFNG